MSDVLADPGTVPLQVFTTAASLLELVDKKVILTLRDGRVVSGYLRSFDTYGNLVIQDAYERLYAPGKYAEKARGVMVVRGENVALLGDVDPEREAVAATALESLEKVNFASLESEIEKEVQAEFKETERTKEQSLRAGLEPVRSLRSY